MPLPQDESRAAASRSVSPATFATCPPEDVRAAAARSDDSDSEAASSDEPAVSSSPTATHAPSRRLHTTTARSAYPSPSPEPGRSAAEETSADESRLDADSDKPLSTALRPGDLPSPPAGSPVDSTRGGDADVRSAHTASSDDSVPQTPSPASLYFPATADERRHPSAITTSFLRPGSKFQGTQKSDRQVYNVQVEIKHVDLASSTMCGYLRIQDLTDEHPSLTTFFEGEIIGSRYLFRTQHASWGACEKTDLTHWARFHAWKPLAKAVKASPHFTLKNFAQREHLFMRWKESFLVPDHRVKTINGASFEGFYYICFNQCSGAVSGIYFHAKSEKFQQLDLEHVPDRGCVAAVEFR